MQFSIVPKQTQLFLNNACVIQKMGVTSLVVVIPILVEVNQNETSSYFNTRASTCILKRSNPFHKKKNKNHLRSNLKDQRVNSPKIQYQWNHVIFSDDVWWRFILIHHHHNRDNNNKCYFLAPSLKNSKKKFLLHFRKLPNPQNPKLLILIEKVLKKIF